MKKTFFIAFVGMSLLLSACKSEFEKIRSSGEVDRIYTKALEYYDQEEYQKAQSLFELIISSYRGKKEAEEIYFKYAYTYYYLEQYILASYYFKNFSNTYGASDLREEADFMSAYSNYQLSPTFRLDQSYSASAIEGFQLFVNTYPNSSRVEECNRLIDEKARPSSRRKPALSQREMGMVGELLYWAEFLVGLREGILSDPLHPNLPPGGEGGMPPLLAGEGWGEVS